MTFDEVQTLSEAVFIDARNPKLFGQGHLPNAINIPYSTLIAKDSKIKSTEELEAIFKGVDFTKPVVFYCGRGIGAAFLKSVAERFPGDNLRAVYDDSYPDYYTRTTGLAYTAKLH